MFDFWYHLDVFGTDLLRQLFSERRRIEAWLEFEVSLARAEARLEAIPAPIADKIADAARIENLDLVAMKAEFDRVGFPIIPLVHQLQKICDPEAARWVHWGATSQDVQDTGMVLQIRDALKLIEADLNTAIDELARLARTHRDTVMAGAPSSSRRHRSRSASRRPSGWTNCSATANDWPNSANGCWSASSAALSGRWRRSARKDWPCARH
jgi:3-carboxy-cis,cis-muconate cycloisomerase